MWILREVGAEVGGLIIRLTKGRVRTVGRSARADFVLDASLVSRLHCRLTVHGDGTLEVQDLDSTNGTFVNGKKVERTSLNHGDELGIGRVKLRVERVP
jgi:pSer/pThr/pTyr-binding forkhead associated (FHA) protein